jgi:hypothetical protein
MDVINTRGPALFILWGFCSHLKKLCNPLFSCIAQARRFSDLGIDCRGIEVADLTYPLESGYAFPSRVQFCYGVQVCFDLISALAVEYDVGLSGNRQRSERLD